MKPLEQLSSSTGLVAIRRIALTATSPLSPIGAIIAQLKQLYPEAEIFLLVQQGRERRLNDIFGGVTVVPALPPGLFSYRSFAKVDWNAIRSLKTDIIGIVYNNRYGQGYSALEWAGLMMGGRELTGLFLIDTLYYRNTHFCQLTTTRLFGTEILKRAVELVAIVRALFHITTFGLMIKEAGGSGNKDSRRS